MTIATAQTRKLVLKMSVSVDGCIAGPNGETDWIFRSSSEDSRRWLINTLRQAGAHMVGSRTYYEWAAFWPFSDSPFAAPMNDIPKIVFSRQAIRDGTQQNPAAGALAKANADRNGDPQDRSGRGGEQRPGVTPSAAVLRSWAEPTVAHGDLAEEVRRLKQQPGNFILAQGGVRFAQSLVAAGLVDEYRLVIHTVVLGQGPSLFSGLHCPADLRLVSTTSFSAGVVAAVYQPA